MAGSGPIGTRGVNRPLALPAPFQTPRMLESWTQQPIDQAACHGRRAPPVGSRGLRPGDTLALTRRL